MRTITIVILAAAAFTQVHAQRAPSGRSEWVALAAGGFKVPDGRTAGAMLVEMNPLLASPDPVLRDDVAFGAAERWILREHRLSPGELRTLLQLWSANLGEGLGAAGDDRVFGRSFSALSLSLIAAADLSSPFLEPAELHAFFDRMLDYFERERDLRDFDPARGWMHTVAHTADTLKFLARNPKLAPGSGTRLLSAVRAKLESHDAVFTWGENDRMALALQSAVRRPDADPAALTAWTQAWVTAHQQLWAKGPLVDPRRFVVVENAKQVMRGLHAALSIEASPTPTGDEARRIVAAALAKTR